jgi:hypothetical protein
MPFGRPGKIVSLSVLLIGVVALLWFVVFPAVDALLPFNNVQVTAPNGSPASHATVITATTGSDTCAC